MRIKTLKQHAYYIENYYINKLFSDIHIENERGLTIGSLLLDDEPGLSVLAQNSYSTNSIPLQPGLGEMSQSSQPGMEVEKENRFSCKI